MSGPHIVTIGKADQDVFLVSKKDFEPFEHKGVLYEQLPLGKKIHVDDMIITTGGNATNTAVTFARQNLRVSYVWALSDDLIGEAILQELDTEGVDTTGVVRVSGLRSSYSTILLAPTGERTVLNFVGTQAVDKSGSPLDLRVLRQADWLYLSSINDMALLEKIVGIAVDAGVKIMMNPSELELAEAKKLKAILEEVEVLLVNKEEAQQLVEGKDAEELLRHLTHYCPVAIVSDGPAGVYATDEKTIVRAGMYEDVKVVDRLGAGDAFGSGFLSQWALGKSLKESIVFASANSTSVVTKIGAKPGILHAGAKLHDMPLHEKPF